MYDLRRQLERPTGNPRHINTYALLRRNDAQSQNSHSHTTVSSLCCTNGFCRVRNRNDNRHKIHKHEEKDENLRIKDIRMCFAKY